MKPKPKKYERRLRNVKRNKMNRIERNEKKRNENNRNWDENEEGKEAKRKRQENERKCRNMKEPCMEHDKWQENWRKIKEKWEGMKGQKRTWQEMKEEWQEIKPEKKRHERKTNPYGRQPIGMPSQLSPHESYKPENPPQQFMSVSLSGTGSTAQDDGWSHSNTHSDLWPARSSSEHWICPAVFFAKRIKMLLVWFLFSFIHFLPFCCARPRAALRGSCTSSRAAISARCSLEKRPRGYGLKNEIHKLFETRANKSSNGFYRGHVTRRRCRQRFWHFQKKYRSVIEKQTGFCRSTSTVGGRPGCIRLCWHLRKKYQTDKDKQTGFFRSTSTVGVRPGFPFGSFALDTPRLDLRLHWMPGCSATWPSLALDAPLLGLPLHLMPRDVIFSCM